MGDVHRPEQRQGGFVDVFDTEGNLVKHFASHDPLHSPWGIALAPDDFGSMSNANALFGVITVCCKEELIQVGQAGEFRVSQSGGTADETRRLWLGSAMRYG